MDDPAELVNARRAGYRLAAQLTACEFVLSSLLELLSPAEIAERSELLRVTHTKELAGFLESTGALEERLSPWLTAGDVIPYIRDYAGSLLLWVDD